MMGLSRASGQIGRQTAICSGYASQGDTPIIFINLVPEANETFIISCSDAGFCRKDIFIGEGLLETDGELHR